MSYFIVYDSFVTVLGLKGNELLVFATLYNAVAHLHGDISISQIIKRSGVSHRSVCRILKKFEDNGWISKSSIGRRGKNHYELHKVSVGSGGRPILAQAEDVTSAIKTHDEKKSWDKNYSQDDICTSVELLLPIVNNL